MAQSQRVQILTTKSEELSVLAEYLKNPKLMAQLEEEIKKINKLSDEEEARLQESKLIIQQKDDAAASHDRIKAETAKHVESHESLIAEKTKSFDDYVASEDEKLKERIAAVALREEVANNESTRLQQWENKLKETAAKISGLVVG